MKLFHLSDIHLGKQLNGGMSLLEEQEYMINQILEQARIHKPDVIIFAGDIYDKSNPSAQTHQLYNDFMNQLDDLNIPVLMIAGNHDSPERLNIGSLFMAKRNIYISTSLPETEDDHLMKITLKDDYGNINFYLLPFMKTGHAKRFNGDISNYTEAIQFMLDREPIDFNQRNVLISHQFYISNGKKPELRDSETIIQSIGGLDEVDVEAVKNFDYVALGHIHSNQCVGYEHIRYCGTPLKYSSSEANDQKVIQVVNIKEKGKLEKLKVKIL
ncbi:MAG: exonuclease subunit SbcD [Holdemanella sp.]|nr:exonuclease subunit SbcD [Holdemanella sp.]